MGSGMVGNTESHREIHFVPNTLPILPRHEFIRDGHFVAGAYRYPSTPDHSVVITRGSIDISSLGLHDFISLFRFARKVAQALASSAHAQRCAMASDGQTIHLIPLHGLSNHWSPVTHVMEEYNSTFPGYLTSKNGPKSPNDVLNNIQKRLVSVSGLQEPFDQTFFGDPSDQNLFARIVRERPSNGVSGKVAVISLFLPRSAIPQDSLSSSPDDIFLPMCLRFLSMITKPC